MLPRASVAAKLMVVVPSLVIANDVEEPLALVGAIGCAPVAEYVMWSTPEPPASVDVRVTVTSVLCTPKRFGAGATAAEVIGAELSTFDSANAEVELPATSIARAATRTA